MSRENGLQSQQPTTHEPGRCSAAARLASARAPASGPAVAVIPPSSSRGRFPLLSASRRACAIASATRPCILAFCCASRRCWWRRHCASSPASCATSPTAAGTIALAACGDAAIAEWVTAVRAVEVKAVARVAGRMAVGRMAAARLVEATVVAAEGDEMGELGAELTAEESEGWRSGAFTI
eukprot:scaffold4870_cov60-Phaeocystis_antarctica.AAC.8